MKHKPIQPGDEFDRLTVIEKAEPKRIYRSDRACFENAQQWLCECSCGKSVIVEDRNLKNGNTHSCGCLRDEQAAINARASSLTHGEAGLTSKTAEYKVWLGINRRCHNPNNPTYYKYGGRGIAVCQEWRESYPAFLAHIGRRPSPEHSIERMDNARGYEPGNVRWATRIEQARNKRNNRLITINGQTRCLSEWAEVSGVKVGTLWQRLKLNWHETRLLQQPKHQPSN